MIRSSQIFDGCLIIACAVTATPAEPEVTFAGAVAPIIYEHCAVCHRPRGVAPFSLLTYDDVRRRGRQIAEVVDSGYMPPWPPSTSQGPALRGARGLSPAEIATLQAWVDGGKPAGDLAATPVLPQFPDTWVLGEPDLVLRFPEPYTLPAEGQDVYRNFVLPISLNGARYVRAVEFRTGEQKVVHHATLLLDPTPRSRQRAAADNEGPGFAGMEFGDATSPGGHFVGWAPGQVPYEVYPGTQWSLTPGLDAVVQVHMLPTGRPEPVDLQIGLYFTTEPPVRPTAVLQLHARELDIVAGEKAYVREERIKLPVPAQVLGVYPHAHYLGKDLQLYAELPDGQRTWLLRIPHWDFNWQSDYRFVEPLDLPAGATLVMHYVYDNSAENLHNPATPPRRVVGGNQSTDEMGEAAIQLLLASGADVEKITQTQLRYEVAGAGGVAPYSYELGIAAQEIGQLAEAERAYRLALQADPQFAPALNRLAELAMLAGQPAEALTLFHRAIEAGPAETGFRFNLAMALYQTGQIDEAAARFAAVLATQPDHRDARLALARLRRQQGAAQEAINLLTAGLSWHDHDGEYLVDLGKILAQTGQTISARLHLRNALIRAGTPALRAEAHLALALIAQQAGTAASGMSHLASALAEQPDFPAARLMAAQEAFRQGQSDVAAVHLAALARTQQDWPSPEAMVRFLPLPDGVILLARELAQANRLADARRLLDAGLARAREAGDAVAFDVLSSALFALKSPAGGS